MHIQYSYSRIQKIVDAFVVFFSIVFTIYTFYMIWKLQRDLCCLPPFAFIDIFTYNATNPSVGIQLFWCAIQHIVGCARTCGLYACVSVPVWGLYATFLNFSPQLSQFHVNGFIGRLTVYCARIFRLRFPLRYFSPLTSCSVFVVLSSVGKLLGCCCLDDQ